MIDAKERRCRGGATRAAEVPRPRQLIRLSGVVVIAVAGSAAATWTGGHIGTTQGSGWRADCNGRFTPAG